MCTQLLRRRDAASQELCRTDQGSGAGLGQVIDPSQRSLTRYCCEGLYCYYLAVTPVCVGAGFINTPMAEAVPEKVLEITRKRIPLGHLGTQRYA